MCVPNVQAVFDGEELAFPWRHGGLELVRFGGVMLQLKSDNGYVLSFTPQSNEFTITMLDSSNSSYTAGLCGKTNNENTFFFKIILLLSTLSGGYRDSFFSAISVSVLAVFTCFPNSRGGSTKVLKKCDYIKLSLLCLNSTKVKVPIKTSARAKVKQYFI